MTRSGGLLDPTWINIYYEPEDQSADQKAGVRTGICLWSRSHGCSSLSGLCNEKIFLMKNIFNIFDILYLVNCAIIAAIILSSYLIF